MTGIEPAFSAWEADVLPLNYTREVGGHCSDRGGEANFDPEAAGRGASLQPVEALRGGT